MNDNDQLKDLVGDHKWFELGSRIIITTRSKIVLDDTKQTSSMNMR